MPATPLATTRRYINPGVTKVLWLPTVGNVATGPTRAEINGGSNLSSPGNLRDWDGFQLTSGRVEAPDVAGRFTAKINGRLEADDSSLTMYSDIGGLDARTLMPQDEEGYIVWMDGGDVEGYPMDTFPVSVAAVVKVRDASGGDPAILEFQYSIINEPSQNVAIPAA